MLHTMCDNGSSRSSRRSDRSKNKHKQKHKSDNENKNENKNNNNDDGLNAFNQAMCLQSDLSTRVQKASTLYLGLNSYNCARTCSFWLSTLLTWATTCFELGLNGFNQSQQCYFQLLSNCLNCADSFWIQTGSKLASTTLTTPQRVCKIGPALFCTGTQPFQSRAQIHLQFRNGVMWAARVISR